MLARSQLHHNQIQKALSITMISTTWITRENILAISLTCLKWTSRSSNLTALLLKESLERLKIICKLDLRYKTMINIQILCHMAHLQIVSVQCQLLALLLEHPNLRAFHSARMVRIRNSMIFHRVIRAPLKNWTSRYCSYLIALPVLPGREGSRLDSRRDCAWAMN